MPEIQKTINICFPRSGHHLLARILKRYFEEDLHYCEVYGHCNTVPCINPETNFQKDHDLDLITNPDLQDFKYIIQYRHPIESFVSWFKLSVENKWEEDTEAAWKNFAESQLVFWKRFVKKWLNDASQNKLFLSYHDFLGDPISHVQKVINFLSPDHSIDISRLKLVLDLENPRRESQIIRFRFFDEVYFSQLEKVLDEIERLKLPRHFESGSEIEPPMVSFSNQLKVSDKPLMKGISVIVCCHNSEKLIGPTIKGLMEQKVGDELSWEIIFVDNNCTDNTVSEIRRLFSRNPIFDYRIIEEKLTGLSNARRAGIRAAKYEFLIFCDDDNHLFPGYVDKAYRILEEKGDVGICIGRNVPDYQVAPSEWFQPLEGVLALGFEESVEEHYMEPPKVPWGAGMVLRKKFIDKLFAEGFVSLLEDRTGKRLSSGGDTELAYLFYHAGYKWLYNPDLTLIHYIPQNRISMKNLRRLYKGFGHAEFRINKNYKPDFKHANMSAQVLLKTIVVLFSKLLWLRLCKRGTNSIVQRLSLIRQITYNMAIWKDRKIPSQYETIMSKVKSIG